LAGKLNTQREITDQNISELEKNINDNNARVNKQNIADLRTKLMRFERNNNEAKNQSERKISTHQGKIDELTKKIKNEEGERFMKVNELIQKEKKVKSKIDEMQVDFERKERENTEQEKISTE